VVVDASRPNGNGVEVVVLADCRSLGQLREDLEWPGVLDQRRDFLARLENHLPNVQLIAMSPTESIDWNQGRHKPFFSVWPSTSSALVVSFPPGSTILGIRKPSCKTLMIHAALKHCICNRETSTLSAHLSKTLLPSPPCPATCPFFKSSCIRSMSCHDLPQNSCAARSYCTKSYDPPRPNTCSDEYQYSDMPIKWDTEKSMGGTYTPLNRQGASGHGAVLLRSGNVSCRQRSKEPAPSNV